MTNTGLGRTIFNRSSLAGRDAGPALKVGDFETAIQIPDTSSPVSGIFILPVARQSGTGPDGAAAEYTLFGAVAVNRPTMLKLLEAGLGDMMRPTLMQAKTEADALNQKSCLEARGKSNITTWQRSDMDLGAMRVMTPGNQSRPH